MDTLNETWRKSRRSNTNGACVEVRRIGDVVQVRDTKDNAQGPVLSFTIDEWSAFTGGVADGDFDL